MVKRLDSSVLEMIAETICGSGSGGGGGYDTPGPYRTGSEIRGFFSRAGVIPRGESSTRKWYALESLEELNRGPIGTHLPEGIEKVLLRLATPHEYRSNMAANQAVIGHLNQTLALEGLALVLDGVQPRLQPRAAQVPPQPKRQGHVPPPDFVQLAPGDPGLASILTGRWEEAQRCVDAGAHLAAVVMMGSVLEGVLLARALSDRASACRATVAPKDKGGAVIPTHDWKLSSLIDVAHEVGWLQGDVKRFSHALRESRNIVHPYLERLYMQDRPDADTCSICWLVVRAAVADLLGSDPV